MYVYGSILTNVIGLDDTSNTGGYVASIFWKGETF